MQFIATLTTKNGLIPILVRVNRKREEIWIKKGKGQPKTEKLYPSLQEHFDSADNNQQAELLAKLENGTSFIL